MLTLGFILPAMIARSVLGFRNFVLPKLSPPNPSLRKSLTSMSSLATNQSEQFEQFDQPLPYEPHTHSSAIIKIPPTPSQPDPFHETNFQTRLEATVLTCRNLQKSALWLQVPMSRSRLIEHMSDVGFRYHHAEGDMANLYLWLKDGMECKIPSYGTHQVGVGALVVNSKDEILCVRELRKNYLPWKIPGGLSELGEHLDQAAIREVLEETGIQTEFQSVLAVRHTHGLQFNRSDLYFICKLRPIEITKAGETFIPEPIPQEGEIAAASWIPMAKYRVMVEREHPTMRQILRLYDGMAEIERSVFRSVVPGREPSPIYHASLPK